MKDAKEPLPLRLSSKGELLLSYLLLFFLPTQLGKHFWPPYAYIYGQRIDYLSPTIYFTDVLIGCLFLLWLLRNLLHVYSQKFKFYPLRFTGVLQFMFVTSILLFIIVGIFQSKYPVLGLYYLLKIAECIFFGFYIATFFTKHINKSLFFLSVGILFESILAIFQYVQQHSLNGIWYFFGERMFSGQTPGIANASINGSLILRPYGTFSHPNVLAGYITIVMTILVFNGHRKSVVYWASLILGTIALVLTLSRVAIVVWLLVLVFRWNLFKGKVLYAFFLVPLVLLFFFSPLSYRFSQSSLGDESVTLREELASSAIAMIREHPILGVGLHNFLVVLPQFSKAHGVIFSFQPVHNIFLLIAAEIGIPCFLLFLSGLIWIIKKLIFQYGKHLSLFLLGEVIVLGMFDHYFLTLQQGQLLLAFVIGLSVRSLSLDC